MSRGVAIPPDVLETGYRSVRLAHWPNGYRSVSVNEDDIAIMMTNEELRELKRLLNEMDLE